MKKKLLAVIMSVLCITAAIPVTPVYADGQKVVTLGADLSEDQKQAILRYFGIAGQNIQTLTITNQDERDHLGSYVPLEQIGTRTFSCALVNPTSSGGIQVKTANLSWVTSNMIATTLSTSGVTNCEVLAAAPFEVSGTGALTGILMAYESAVGATLDSAKKEVATQELITTTTIAGTIGQAQATDLVNESKKQIIQGNVVNNAEIEIVIDEVAAEEGITLTTEERQLLTDLMYQISEQDYNYEDMEETLERVDQNLDEFEMEEDDDFTEEESPDDGTDLAAPATDDSQNIDGVTVIGDVSSDTGWVNPDFEVIETPETLPSDSILMNTDDSALGAEVVFDATDQSALDQDSDDMADIDDTVGVVTLPEEATQTPADAVVIPSESTDASNTDTGAEIIPDASVPSDTSGAEMIPEDTAEEEWTDSVVEPTLSADTPLDTTVIPDASDNAEVIPDTSDDITVIPDAGGEVIAEVPSDAVAVPVEGTDVTVIPDESTDTAADPSSGEPVALNLEIIGLTDMKFSPLTAESTAYQVFQAGINELTVDLARADIIGGTGTLTLYHAADSGIVETVALNDPEKVSIRALTPEELTEYGWSAGSRAVITLNDPLAPLTAYYVMLTDDAFQTTDGIGTSAATPDSYSWTINTGEYGFYINDTAEGITAGTSVTGQISMESELAVYACIENADPAMVTFDMTEFLSSGSFTATFAQAGTASFQVSFYDEAGTCLYTMTYEVTVK